MTSETLDRYASVHPHAPNTPDERPTAKQVVKDCGVEGAWSDKVVLITGATSGIGLESAKALATTGATLILTARDSSKADALFKEFDGQSSQDRVTVLPMDLNSLHSVKQAAAAIKKQTKTLNVLLCNAGIMACPEAKTEDGLESQFGVNFVAHYTLFKLLEPLLQSSSSKAFASRVVVVSSSGHRISPVHLDDYNFEKSQYNEWVSYGQSKTATIYMSNHIERSSASTGIHANSLHPGSIFTSLQRHQSGMNKDAPTYQTPEMQAMLKSLEQGAATSVWACIAPELEGKGGLYLEDVQVAGLTKEDGPRGPGYAAHAFDEEKEERLMKIADGILHDKAIH